MAQRGEAAVPSECVITGYMKNILGDNQSAGTMIITNANAFFHGTHLIQPNAQVVSITSDGFFKVSLIETASISTTTASRTFKFEVKFNDANGITQKFNLGSAEIPNTATAELSTLGLS